MYLPRTRLLAGFLASFVLVALLPVATAGVPCFLGDDGFDTGCCNEPHPNLPKFPKVVEKGIYACVRNCTPESRFDVKVTVGEPQFFLCDTAVIELDVSPAAIGGPQITGKLIAKYSRTWFSTVGGGQQVWRFLLNGDIDFGPAIGINGCPVPPHPGPTHVVGSIDYTCDPNSPTDPASRIALNLSHLPGCISHGPFSARPLVGAQAHNDRSYHLVAPNNFGFGVVNDMQGTLRREAVRSSPTGNCFPWSYRCLSEANVVDGKLSSVFKNCLCANFLGGAWIHQDMEGKTECNGASTLFATFPNFDPVIPRGLAGMRLGRWAGPAWPGDQELTVYVGYLRYDEPCVGPVADEPHRVSGVGTRGPKGFLFKPSPIEEAYENFLDLQDHLLPAIATPVPVTDMVTPVCVPLKRGFGAPAYSSLVWNLNPEP